MLGADDKENNLSPWQDSKTGSSTLFSSPPPPPLPPLPSDRETMVKKAIYYVHISSVVQVYTVYQLNQNRTMKRTFPEKLTQHSRRKYKYKGLEFANTVLKHD